MAAPRRRHWVNGPCLRTECGWPIASVLVAATIEDVTCRRCEAIINELALRAIDPAAQRARERRAYQRKWLKDTIRAKARHAATEQLIRENEMRWRDLRLEHRRRLEAEFADELAALGVMVEKRTEAPAGSEGPR